MSASVSFSATRRCFLPGGTPTPPPPHGRGPLPRPVPSVSASLPLAVAFSPAGPQPRLLPMAGGPCPGRCRQCQLLCHSPLPLGEPVGPGQELQRVHRDAACLLDDGAIGQ